MQDIGPCAKHLSWQVEIMRHRKDTAAPQPPENVTPLLEPCLILWMATIVPQIGNDLSFEMFVAADLGRFFQNLYSRGVEYFETLQPTTTGITYFICRSFKKGNLISCNRPCHQRRWNMPTLHRSWGSWSFNHWWILPETSWFDLVDWLVG